MNGLKPSPFPGYDVMAKRATPSFNDATRQTLDQRLSITGDKPRFFTFDEMTTLTAIAGRIVPQPENRPHVPIAGLIDHRLHQDHGDGYRTGQMPKQREAWRQGLAALEAETRQAYDRPFPDLDPSTQDLVLKQMEQGDLTHPAWKPMTARQFFKERLSHDIVIAYYSHPIAWNEMGFGGPASPRGYVRMGYNERDPWEAAEITDGNIDAALKDNRRVGQ